MNTEQLTEQVLKHNGDIAALGENVKSAHKRIDENDRITDGIHKLAANVEALALQVKLLTEDMKNNMIKFESGLKSQGERIGVLEKEPGGKWKALTAQIVSIVVAAVMAVIITKFV